MSAFGHVLVVGGTGMLRQAVAALAGRSGALTSLARSPHSQEALLAAAAAAGVPPGRIHGVPVNYRDDHELETAVEGAIEARGPVDLVLAWIHSTAPRAPGVLARAVAASVAAPAGDGRAIPMYQVLASASADPTTHFEARRDAFAGIPSLAWRGIVLGFVRERSRSRWLTDDEIAAGVLQAIEAGRERHVVGTTAPWSARP